MSLLAKSKKFVAVLAWAGFSFAISGCAPEASSPAAKGAKPGSTAPATGGTSATDKPSGKSQPPTDGSDDAAETGSSSYEESMEQAGSSEDLGAEVPSPADAPEEGQ